MLKKVFRLTKKDIQTNIGIYILEVIIIFCGYILFEKINLIEKPCGAEFSGAILMSFVSMFFFISRVNFLRGVNVTRKTLAKFYLIYSLSFSLINTVVTILGNKMTNGTTLLEVFFQNVGIVENSIYIFGGTFLLITMAIISSIIFIHIPNTILGVLGIIIIMFAGITIMQESISFVLNKNIVIYLGINNILGFLIIGSIISSCILWLAFKNYRIAGGKVDG